MLLSFLRGGTRQAIFRISLLVLVLAGAGLVAARLRTPTPAHASGGGPSCSNSLLQITTTDNWPVSNSFSGAKFTRIDQQGLDGDPQAILQVTPNWTPTHTYENHPIGVFYYSSHWYISTEDGAPMPTGAAFNVYWESAPNPSYNYCGLSNVVQTATSANLISGDTYIDQPGLDGQGGAGALVTSNETPGGTGGISDPHPIGVGYDTFRGRWYIFNEDGTPIPAGASFNVTWNAPNTDFHGAHQATVTNSNGDFTVLNDAALVYTSSSAVIFVTPAFFFNPGIVGAHGVYENHNLGVFWNGSNWCIFDQDGVPIPTGATFFYWVD